MSSQTLWMVILVLGASRTAMKYVNGGKSINVALILFLNIKRGNFTTSWEH